METFTKSFTLKFCFLILLISLFQSNSLNAKEFLARVTYYWSDPITSTGKKPICGKTIAVDPKIIPYGSTVFIPKMGKWFSAQDTGSAVVKRTASKKLGRPECIVVDVYCSTKAIALNRIKTYPMFMKIIVKDKK
jgi:hypothetical protein